MNLSLGLPTDDETYFRLNLRMPRNPGKSSNLFDGFSRATHDDLANAVAGLAAVAKRGVRQLP